MKFLNKRIISLLLAMVMLCGMMPMTAFATEGTQETEAVEVVTEPTEAPEEETTTPAEDTEETEPSEPSLILKRRTCAKMPMKREECKMCAACAVHTGFSSRSPVRSTDW